MRQKCEGCKREIEAKAAREFFFAGWTFAGMSDTPSKLAWWCPICQVDFEIPGMEQQITVLIESINVGLSSPFPAMLELRSMVECLRELWELYLAVFGALIDELRVKIGAKS